ncbi:MAG: tetratricopeptide repeat protein [Anaerolineales bacterium]|jgi:tetratricopeptide (TPR) repeat protein|uniref:tetratricopeptide repeat protein n=1 Tax=Candidatus Villigracilis vicinus TaxID=3140679 RepID=UPI003136E48A|nr:tetratricopeptide repeat protein [Anaerolineales bacterium]MBK7449305.1 tetratricopeptide repeat protein [Anaerolineales bacterium]MBK9779767.1 tetratricopeptide repeat protein [Anaerolineales bacterium]
MNKKRTRPNWFRIILLSLLVLAGAYVNRFVVADIDPLGVPSPTPTISPETLIAEAEGLFKQGKLLPAIDAYQQAVVSQPENPATHIMLARTLAFAGKYKEAQISAEDALLLNPSNSMAHAVRGWALNFQGEYLEAESSIKRALELDPNNALAHAYYVEILIDSYYSGLGSFDGIEKAIEESKVAQALAPDLIETHRARGYILEATGNYEEAIREYEAAIAINANIADLYLAMGRNYRILGIYDKAVDSFTRADALNPEDPNPDLLLSRTYATIGEYGKAMQFAESAVTNNPADTNLRGNLGVMYYRNAYWTEAIQELSYVVKGGLSQDGIEMEVINLVPDAPRIAEYYFTYGLALSRTDQCGEALQIAQLIVSRIPADELAVENANEITSRCQQTLDAPLSTATEEPVATAEAEATPTP